MQRISKRHYFLAQAFLFLFNPSNFHVLYHSMESLSRNNSEDPLNLFPLWCRCLLSHTLWSLADKAARTSINRRVKRRKMVRCHKTCPVEACTVACKMPWCWSFNMQTGNVFLCEGMLSETAAPASGCLCPRACKHLKWNMAVIRLEAGTRRTDVVVVT